MDLNKDVKYVKGVGPNRVKLLNKLGPTPFTYFTSLFKSINYSF